MPTLAVPARDTATLTSQPRPPSRMPGASPNPQRAADRARGRALGAARERLVAALDALGDRVPSAGELVALVRLAGEAFLPDSAAARVLRLLVLDRVGYRR